jgi:hypothetical protein
MAVHRSSSKIFPKIPEKRLTFVRKNAKIPEYAAQGGTNYKVFLRDETTKPGE